MAGYASDIESLGLIGGGAQGFIKGWQDAEDRKQKKMELDSKLQTEDEARKRNQVQQAIQLKQSGLAQSSTDPTQLTDAPLSARQQGQQAIEIKKSGLSAQTDSTTGEVVPSSVGYDTSSPQSIGAHAKIVTADARTNAAAQKGQVKPSDWVKFNQALDPNGPRAGNLGKTQAMINASDRVHGIFQQFPDGNVPAAQGAELATATAAMISGGSPQSQHQIEMIMPKSAQGDINKAISWVTGNPRGAEQQEFMRVLRETSERERAIAMKQKYQAQVERLSGWEHMQEADPDHYARVLKSKGIDLDNPPQDYQAPPQGLTQPPQSQGMLGLIRGMMGGGANAAPAQPAKPTTIIQNGHTYTLNPKTGGYE